MKIFKRSILSLTVLCLTLPSYSFIQDTVVITSDTIPLKRNIVITGVGDIMLGSSFPSAKYLPPHDNPYLLLEELADTLRNSDITFGNLEGSFLDDGPAAKKCRDTTACYLFRMPERYITALTATGFDVVSVANNHFGDFGMLSRKRTQEILDSANIEFAGLIEKPWAIFDRDSVRYGFCAFAPNAGTVNINDTVIAAAIVRMLNDSCDIVIVSFHGGAEGKDFQNLTRQSEIFYGEDRGNVYEFAHKMIDCGADVVFGHGPHVVRSVEVYNERFISYSLGNFCTYGRFNLAGPNSLAPVIKINVDIQGRFISGRIIPGIQPWPGGVKFDPSGQVINKIRELVAQDLPESVIDISESGRIEYKQDLKTTYK